MFLFHKVCMGTYETSSEKIFKKMVIGSGEESFPWRRTGKKLNDTFKNMRFYIFFGTGNIF